MYIYIYIYWLVDVIFQTYMVNYLILVACMKALEDMIVEVHLLYMCNYTRYSL